MKTAILYSSTHGSSEKAARLLAGHLSPQAADLFDLRKTADPSLASYGRVIIGGSIHFGQMQKRVKRFCQRHLQELQQKELGLFMCCLQQEKENEQFSAAFPLSLREHSLANGFFGGELLVDKLSLLQKLALKVVGKKLENQYALDEEAIKTFAAKIRQAPDSENTAPHPAPLASF